MGGDEGEWDRAMREHLRANAAAGRKPATWRQLHRALATLDENAKPEATWKTLVSRWRREEAEPSERNAQMVAQALGVPREQLPPPGRLTPAQIRRRLQEHEARIAALETLNEEVADLTQRLKIALGQFRRLVDEPHSQETPPGDEAPPSRPASG